MLRRLIEVWFPRLLFVLSMSAAAVLAAAVLLGQTLFASAASPLLRLFAVDATVRRTALISAAGLALTALLFFRLRDPEGRRHRREPPRTMAGA